MVKSEKLCKAATLFLLLFANTNETTFSQKKLFFRNTMETRLHTIRHRQQFLQKLKTSLTIAKKVLAICQETTYSSEHVLRKTLLAKSLLHAILCCARTMINYFFP